MNYSLCKPIWRHGRCLVVKALEAFKAKAKDKGNARAGARAQGSCLQSHRRGLCSNCEYDGSDSILTRSLCKPRSNVISLNHANATHSTNGSLCTRRFYSSSSGFVDFQKTKDEGTRNNITMTDSLHCKPL